MASVSDRVADSGAHRFVGERRAGVEERYRAARRHSTFVRLLKVMLPAAGLVGTAVFVAYAYLLPGLPNGISVDSYDVRSDAIVMENPKVSGFQSGGRSYSLHAARAIQSLKDTKLVTLEELSATVGLGGDGQAMITAQRGIYNGNKQTLDLRDSVTLETTMGYSGKASAVMIDLRGGGASTNSPVELRSSDGVLHAKRMVVAEGGQRIRFTNGVKMSFVLPDDPGTSVAAPAVRE